MQADPDLSPQVRLLLQFLEVCSSHLVSSASDVPEVTGREKNREDGWPQVLLPFIFVRLVRGCVKIVSSPCLQEAGDVISRTHLAGIARNSQVPTPAWELPQIPVFWYIDGVHFDFHMESFASPLGSSCPPAIPGQCCCALHVP